MASSETIISNLALGKIGDEKIMSLDDASESARFCKLFYAQTRDEVLRSHKWNFATKRETLSQLAAAPPFGWDYQYTLPNDCLRVTQINGFQEWEQTELFEIEGRNLLTDQETAEIKYTASITDANLFDPLFIEALACKLAFKICIPLTDSSNRAQELLAEYNRVTGTTAMMVDAFEGRKKRKRSNIDSDFVNSRYGSNLG